MPRRASNVVRFPAASGIVITDAEHRLLVSVVGPFYGQEVASVLDRAPVVPGGKCIDTTLPAIDDLLGAISCEVHGYQKLEDERNGHARSRPARGSTAHQLMAVYDRIDRHRS